MLERSLNKDDFSSATSIDINKDATSYSDKGLETGKTYWYRIKAVKGELSSSYSNKDSAEVGIYTSLAKNINSVVSVYPNPSSSSVVFIKMDKRLDSNIEARIFNFSGQIVKRIDNIQQNSEFELEMDVSNLNRGVYIIELSDSNVNYFKLIRE